MDVATPMVRAYMGLNGYLTAAEYPLVLGAALARFGCCLPEEGPDLVRALLQKFGCTLEHREAG